MNLRERLTSFVRDNAVPIRESVLGPSLATLSVIDDDEHLFRRITQTTRDLSSLTQERQREIAYYLADANPFARRIINMTRDFVVGRGSEWSIQAKNKSLHEVLVRHWADPYNSWPNKLRSRCRELGLSGEQCYTAETGPDGIVRLGYVDSGTISAVVPYSDNFEIVREVVLKRRQSGGERIEKLKAISYDLQQKRMVGFADGDDRTAYVGLCFFYAVNKPIRATRGRSDLFAVADALDGLDQFHWSRLERLTLANSFIWDVLLKGSDARQQQDFLRENRAPKPGGLRVHNENVEWTTVAPNLGAVDASEDGRMLRIPVLTGSGFPEHWLFGIGENANRASSYEMQDPPIRMAGGRQEELVELLTTILRYQADVAMELGILSGVRQGEQYDFSINAPEVSARDMLKGSQILVGVATALAGAMMQQIVTHRTAVLLFGFVASQLGMTIDAEEELAQLVGGEEEQGAPAIVGGGSLDDEGIMPGDKEPAGVVA